MLVRATHDSASHAGMNTEDEMTVLAYNAVKRLQAAEERALAVALRTVMPFVIVKNVV